MSALVVLNLPHVPGVNPIVPGNRFERENPLLRMWQSVKRQIVDDVPEALATCQFDCGRSQCLLDAGLACERLSRKSAGELSWALPLGKPAPAYRVFTA
jgi:hypothetical protein